MMDSMIKQTHIANRAVRKAAGRKPQKWCTECICH